MTGQALVPDLVGDIGGTHARFALAAEDRIERQRTLVCAEHAALADAVEHYFERLDAESVPRPRRAALAVACPVGGDQVKLTNHVWSFSIEATRRRLALDRLLVLNDFAALALGVPGLETAQTRSIKPGDGVVGDPIAVIGPGTGLGMGALVLHRGEWVAVAGEGGHRDLAAADEREWSVLRRLQERFGHVSAERAVSGPGLVNLHRALCELEGEPPGDPEPAEIVWRAARCGASEGGATERGALARAAEAVRLFCGWLGAVASDLALTVGARGGVFLGGGILPQMGETFDAALFNRRFVDKGRFASYLDPIPVRLVLDPGVALRGAAQALRAE